MSANQATNILVPLPAQTVYSRELLSGLIDGESEGQEGAAALERLCTHTSVQQDWTTWHLVGDALRSSETACWHSTGFSERVAAALQNEPALLAPRALQKTSSRRLIRRVVMPGAAAAAAAVVLGVVALPQLRSGSEVAVVPASTAQIASSTAPAATPVAISAASNSQLNNQNLSEFDTYLEAHRELTQVMGMPRTSPYLRTVTQIVSDR